MGVGFAEYMLLHMCVRGWFWFASLADSNSHLSTCSAVAQIEPADHPSLWLLALLKQQLQEFRIQFCPRLQTPWAGTTWPGCQRQTCAEPIPGYVLERQHTHTHTTLSDAQSPTPEREPAVSRYPPGTFKTSDAQLLPLAHFAVALSTQVWVDRTPEPVQNPSSVRFTRGKSTGKTEL